MSADELAGAFVVAVEAAAPRLELEHGLAPAGTERPGEARARVAFDGRGTRVTFTYDRGEIDAVLSLTDGSERAFQLGLLLGLAGVRDWRTRWPRIIGAGTTGTSVGALVGDVIDHTGPWLRGEEEALQRLDDFRAVDVELKMAQFGVSRRPSEEWDPVRSAWDRQDVDDLADALLALPGPRRQAEETALAYARRYGGGEEEAAPGPSDGEDALDGDQPAR
jgi:hypothetical protein